MASLQDTVTVSVKVETTVPRPIAEHIANEMLEWLDNQGWSIVPKHGDERDYQELARDFIEEWS